MRQFKRWTRKLETPAIKQRIRTSMAKVLDGPEEEIICYRCKKPGYIEPNCPLKKFDKGKKKK